MLILAGSQHCCVVWRYGSRCRKCRYLQCVSVPDPNLLWPLTRLGETFDQYQRAMASPRVMNLLDTPIAIHTGYSFACGLSPRRVGTTGCHLAYNGRNPVIQNLSLHIPAGKTIAIVGSTGSGKSTLVKPGCTKFKQEPSGSMALICVS